MTDVETVYLDLETTGLSPKTEEVVEVAICDDRGRPLIDTLVRPARKRSWPYAERVHGISPAMVRDRPRLADILPEIHEAVRGKRLVIYNSSFDLGFFEDGLAAALEARCAMREYAAWRKAPGGRGGGYKWFKLADAARACNHVWTGDAHRALADALACRTVWNWVRAAGE